MNLNRMLGERAAEDRPVRIGVIGAGAFGAMFLSQAPRTAGMHVVAIADRDVARARATLAKAGWERDRLAATTAASALAAGTTLLTDDANRLLEIEELEVVIEATGDPAAGIQHAIGAIEAGCHIVMVNVEADVLAGPLLAARAAEAGVVYSLAYGDQPALICELVDWARTAGFEVVAAGKGTRYLPEYVGSTPDTVWGHYDLAPERAAAAGFNPKLFNSFLDGTKSAIEMGAVANATGLTASTAGLAFPPGGRDDLADVLRPRDAGGALERAGTVEVVSSLHRDGTPVERDLRWGVYVVIRAPDDFVAERFAAYGVRTDASGRYASLYRPYHFIGLELGISVASVALRGEPTGSPSGFRADAVAVAKRDLAAGEELDGEGGYTIAGQLRTADDSLRDALLPIGLGHGVRLQADAAAGEPLRWSQVEIDDRSGAAAVRREMERTCGAMGGLPA